MKWCEDHDVGFVLGLARNRRLTRALGAAMHEAHSVHRRTGKAARRFRDFTYRTRKSWSRDRWVVGKAEYLSKGENPRFVVTNLSLRKAVAKRLYEKLYCARGEMENRIKEQQLFADRTSAHTMRANQLRLYFSSFAIPNRLLRDQYAESILNQWLSRENLSRVGGVRVADILQETKNRTALTREDWLRAVSELRAHLETKEFE